jgi:hypothetical protein
MMTRLFSIMILFVTLASLSACLVRTRSNAAPRRARSCPPAHHWDGYACVHNGRHKGHRRH